MAQGAALSSCPWSSLDPPSLLRALTLLPDTFTVHRTVADSHHDPGHMRTYGGTICEWIR